jgi:uncharacterized membrane protein YeaQ/YmgE (transglycosylase-associated protein family)
MYSLILYLEYYIVTAKTNIMHLILYLIIGGLAGFLAGKALKGEGFGIIVDIIVGIVGGWLGSWLFGALQIAPIPGHVGELVTAFIGACILVYLSRLMKK